MEPPVIEKQRYRKHGAYYYPDEKTITLPFHAKSIGSYVLVGQVNRVGIFTFSVGLAQEELGLSPKIFKSNFELVLNTFGWKFDCVARVLYVPTWWRYNAPENPNVLIGALDDLSGLPKTPLLNEFSANVQYLPANLRDTFTQRMEKRLATQKQYQKQYQNQNQKQEQEQEQEQETPPYPLAPASGRSVSRTGKGESSDSKSKESVLMEWTVSTWNALPGVRNFQGQPDQKMQRRLKQLWREHPERPWWLEYFRRIAGTTDLIGHLESGWCADLLWAIRQGNIEKVQSGAYGEPMPLEE